VLLNPARPGTWWLDRSGFNKRPAEATTRPNPVDPGEPGRDPFFFFFSNVVFETHLYIYSMFPRKSHVFSMWDKKHFGLNTST